MGYQIRRFRRQVEMKSFVGVTTYIIFNVQLNMDNPNFCNSKSPLIQTFPLSPLNLMPFIYDYELS
jgi:hypothetical protein